MKTMKIRMKKSSKKIINLIIFINMPFGANINENNEDKNEKVLKKNN